MDNKRSQKGMIRTLNELDHPDHTVVLVLFCKFEIPPSLLSQNLDGTISSLHQPSAYPLVEGYSFFQLSYCRPRSPSFAKCSSLACSFAARMVR
jgi:hypothetical protein